MSRPRLSAFAVAIVLLLAVAPTVFGAPLRQVIDDYLMIGGQTTLSLNVKLEDGSTIVVPVDVQVTTHLLNGNASMDVRATIGEGDSAITATAIDIPAVIEVVPETPTTAPTGATASSNANLRQGPGTDFAVVGRVQEGEALDVVGRNSDTTWLQLANRAGTPTSVPPTFTPTATIRPCDPSYPDEDMCITPGAPD